MLGKVINSYFQNIQDIFNGYGIVFDTLYTNQIDDYKQAMTNYNLRQMYDFDVISSLRLTKEQLDNLTGKSYNVLQYKYSAPVKNDTTAVNNQTYKILYTPKTDSQGNTNIRISATDLYNRRKTVELSNEIEQALQAEFIEFQKNLSPTDPLKVMQNTIQQTTAFEVTPKYPTNTTSNPEITRLGFYADIPIECRFITSSSEMFEQFIILYSILFHKINPAAYITTKEWGEGIKFPIRTKYEAISSAQQIDTNTQGNLLEISFSVTLSALLLSGYYLKSSYINEIDLHFEVRNNQK